MKRSAVKSHFTPELKTQKVKHLAPTSSPASFKLAHTNTTLTNT
jgi:hypothetical protein